MGRVVALGVLANFVFNCHSLVRTQKATPYSSIIVRNNSMTLHGTLIAAFFTKAEIFLASDGRVIHTDSGKTDNKGQSNPEKIFFEIHKRVYFNCW